jgi:DNA excision repair protein ERCC-3
MAESDRAAVVQGDRSILVEVDHPAYEEARSALAPFAEIEKSPEHVHTYRISALSLWNAASTGLGADEVIAALRRISRFEVPNHLEHEIRETMSRHGVCSLHDVSSDPSVLRLAVKNDLVKKQLAHSPKASEYLRPCPDGFLLDAAHRGVIKQVLLKVGFPVDDRAGMREGEPLPIATRADVFEPYPYQRAASRAFIDAGGHGVVVLPCGAGKTVVAMLAMADLSTRTLVLSTGADAAEQWKRELVHKTDLPPEAVAIYGAKNKAVGPVTITTYSMLAQRGGGGPTHARHFDRLASEGFGLIVYDEVHLLPAPVFRLTAEIQARRRLGLTATLVREDGRASDVFALIGPKRFDIPWRELEKSGHIAKALCIEVRVPFPEALRDGYAIATPGPEQARAAADNPRSCARSERSWSATPAIACSCSARTSSS